MSRAHPAERHTLEGQTVVITGASDGIGKAAVEGYAARGANVVMVGRNESKTRAAADDIMRKVDVVGGIEIDIADLSRLSEVRALAGRLAASHPRIHVLANNAGALFLNRRETEEGIESTLALNHLSIFVLTLLLLNPLAAAATPDRPTRVLVVSSRAHKDARLSPDDLQLKLGYAGWRAYANSKLCNLLFVHALSRRLDPHRVVVHGMHPGVVSTRFARSNGLRGRLMRWGMDIVSLTPAEGADTLIWLGESDASLRSTGDYWVKRKRAQPSRQALDPSLSEDIWRRSAELAGLDADALVAHSEAATH